MTTAAEPEIDHATGEILPGTGEEGEPLAEPAEPAEPLEPDAADEQLEEPESRGETRCEAMVNMSGTIYQCGLQEAHEGEHAFVPADEQISIAEPPSPSEPPLSDEDREQAKKLATAAKAYTKKVIDILGDDLSGWIGCELCGAYFPGLRAPVGLPGEVAAQLRILLGMPSMDNFHDGEGAQECPACGGYGKVKTGSRVERFATMTCRRCRGTGALLDGAALGAGEHEHDHPQVPGEQLEELEPAPDADPWGRPKGDPLYGVMPGYEAFH